MKKIFVLLAAFSFTVGVASAQTKPAKANYKVKTDQSAKGQETPEQKAEHMARRMTKSLGLSTTQTEQVRQLHLARHQEMQAQRGQYATADKSTKREALRAGNDKYEAQLKQILSADQYAKYAQVRANKMEKNKANRKARG